MSKGPRKELLHSRPVVLRFSSFLPADIPRPAWTHFPIPRKRVGEELNLPVAPALWKSLLKAIDYIIGLGAFPTVCVFRPTMGSDMEGWSPPRYEDMLIVFRHVYEAYRRNNIPIDVTPNIEVSLVVQPGDTRYLAPAEWSCSYYDLKMRLLTDVTPA